MDTNSIIVKQYLKKKSGGGKRIEVKVRFPHFTGGDKMLISRSCFKF